MIPSNGVHGENFIVEFNPSSCPVCGEVGGCFRATRGQVVCSRIGEHSIHGSCHVQLAGYFVFDLATSHSWGDPDLTGVVEAVQLIVDRKAGA